MDIVFYVLHSFSVFLCYMVAILIMSLPALAPSIFIPLFPSFWNAFLESSVFDNTFDSKFTRKIGEEIKKLKWTWKIEKIELQFSFFGLVLVFLIALGFFGEKKELTNGVIFLWGAFWGLSFLWMRFFLKYRKETKKKETKTLSNPKTIFL